MCYRGRVVKASVPVRHSLQLQNQGMTRLMQFVGSNPTGSKFFGGYSDSLSNLTALINIFDSRDKNFTLFRFDSFGISKSYSLPVLSYVATFK